MNPTARAGDRRPRSRGALVSVAGLLLAVLAESCSVGLLGLSGWFIASSAVAGASIYSAFSYLAPSGGVRAFALGRIATGYASRVVLHAAALRRISAARLGFYDHAAADPATHGTWSGQSLDRVMADADTTGMALIQATAPVTVAVAMTAGGCLVIVLAGYPLVAMVLAVAAACAALAILAARRTDDGSRTRGALRTELVTAIGAWTEMASLGATDQLAHRTLQRLVNFESQRFLQAVTSARTLGAARAVTAAALALTVALAAARGASVATLVFIVLVAAGVMGNAERLVAATQAWTCSNQGGQRLASAGSDKARRPGHVLPALRATYDRRGLTVSGYRLPDTPTRTARQLEFAVAPGQTLVVTGASGSGKSTLLNTIAATLPEATGPQPAVVTAVLADDCLFTGTVATNIRLANPTASDDDINDLLATMSLDRTGLHPSTEIGASGRDLSGGEQRRLHLARALATHPDVLLIDEPTTGLDTSTAAHVLKAIHRRLPHAVLVLAMHEPPAAPDPLGSAWSTMPLDYISRWPKSSARNLH
jgi:ATP-binding cassette, subfamily C, bacterial CydC